MVTFLINSAKIIYIKEKPGGESMGGGWQSFIVAIGIILLFYLVMKHGRGLPKPSKKKGITPKKGKKTQGPVKELEMILSKKEKPNHKSSPMTARANLIMHPRTSERAKEEYLKLAVYFRGYYELLYLCSIGEIAGEECRKVLINWEEKILATNASHLLLAWNTIVQKHCKRNLYYRGNSVLKDHQGEKEILQDWLKLLGKWGLHRVPHKKVQSDYGFEQIGEVMGGHCWLLNGEILEEGQSAFQSFGQ